MRRWLFCWDFSQWTQPCGAPRAWAEVLHRLVQGSFNMNNSQTGAQMPPGHCELGPITSFGQGVSEQPLGQQLPQ